MLKKVLLVDLKNKSFDVKSYTELNQYIGGVGVGLKLLHNNMEHDPIVFSVGPLNGFFPYASKTSIVFQHEGVVEDIYLGGTLSTRLKYCGLDSIIILGKSDEPVLLDIHNETVHFRSVENNPDELGLPGKRSVIRPVADKFMLDNYFTAPDNFLEEKIIQKNVRGIIVTGTKTYEIHEKEKYEELYFKILTRAHELNVKSDQNPSCSGCPMGCNKSAVGEIGGNVLVHSLVACQFSEPIYSNIGVVFSCLNILGYDYTHEDIEALPTLIDNVLKELT